MIVHTARAVWRGTLLHGNGDLHLNGMPHYSFASRFADATGTSPEELLAASFATCFSMAFASLIEQVGQAPEIIQTQVNIHLSADETMLVRLKQIVLDVEVKASEMDQAWLLRIAQQAKEHCVISQLLLSSVLVNLSLTMLT